MLNQDLKDVVVSRILPTIRTPGQYVGGELNSIAKDHRTTRGTVCLAFPDTYALGMSHHGLQVLYSLMNATDWSCERVFTPLPDFEDSLRQHGLPLYSLETFTPLKEFDLIGEARKDPNSHALVQCLEGSCIGRAWEQLIAVDQIVERHRLLA